MQIFYDAQGNLAPQSKVGSTLSCFLDKHLWFTHICPMNQTNYGGQIVYLNQIFDSFKHVPPFPRPKITQNHNFKPLWSNPRFIKKKPVLVLTPCSTLTFARNETKCYIFFCVYIIKGLVKLLLKVLVKWEHKSRR